jgi:predicted DNA-binding protein
MSASSKPIPLAIPNQMLARINDLAEKMNKSKAEIMRLAMEVGIADLNRIDWQIGDAVVDASDRVKILSTSTLAEAGADYAMSLRDSAKGKKPKGKKDR